MAADRTGIVVGLLGAALLALSACTSTTPDTAGSPPGSPLPAPPTTVPPSVSGALGATSLPEPQQLGPGWEYRVEGADLEDGAGNDTPFQQRNPEEIVVTTIPMGCEQRSPSPTPLNVLQATYQDPETARYAVVLRMRFGTEEEAERFAALRLTDLVACRDQPDDPYSGAPAPVQEVDSSTATYQLPGEPATWTTIAALDGTDLVTLDTDADPGTLGWIPPSR